MGFSQSLSLCAFLAVIIGGTAFAQELPRGEIVEDVPCQQDASQRYALYLPSYFNLSRRWPVILAFDGGGGGREGVERYIAPRPRNTVTWSPGRATHAMGPGMWASMPPRR
jgi:hypothetical protein